MTPRTKRTLRLGSFCAAVALAAGGVVASAAPTAPTTPAPAAPKERVRIIFQTVPPVKSAKVLLGGRKLGEIAGRNRPLIVERARDSGPLDVVVQSEGYLPVHTRAYTFTDSKVFVKLTLEEEKHTLFGYKEELPALPDGGVAADAGPSPAAPTAPSSAPDAGAPR